jgi:hypothetical protein
MGISALYGMFAGFITGGCLNKFGICSLLGAAQSAYGFSFNALIGLTGLPRRYIYSTII